MADTKADDTLQRLLSWHQQFSMNGAAQLERVQNFLGLGKVPPKVANPVRIGVLGASNVATYAMIWPARRLPDVEVVAVAARDADRAAKYAKRHRVPNSYGSYDELVNDPTLDAVYVALPNGLHGEWSKKALDAGKHVLCEKPFTADAQEASEVQALAGRRQLLCREAFHYREHPANVHTAALLRSGAIGELQEADVRLLIPSWAFGGSDIRFKKELAGGAMMDAGAYCTHALRYFMDCARPKVLTATPQSIRSDGFTDEGMSVVVDLGGGVRGTFEASLRHAGLLPVIKFVAKGTGGTLEMDNFVMPFFGHKIKLTTWDSDAPRVPSSSQPSRALGAPMGAAAGLASMTAVQARPAAEPSGATTRTEQVFDINESNYYYQLRRFVADLHALQGAKKKGDRRAASAILEADASDSTANMEFIENVYKAAGLPPRKPTLAWKALKV